MGAFTAHNIYCRYDNHGHCGHLDCSVNHFNYQVTCYAYILFMIFEYTIMVFDYFLLFFRLFGFFFLLIEWSFHWYCMNQFILFVKLSR